MVFILKFDNKKEKKKYQNNKYDNKTCWKTVLKSIKEQKNVQYGIALVSFMKYFLFFYEYCKFLFKTRKKLQNVCNNL